MSVLVTTWSLLSRCLSKAVVCRAITQQRILFFLLSCNVHDLHDVWRWQLFPTSSRHCDVDGSSTQCLPDMCFTVRSSRRAVTAQRTHVQLKLEAHWVYVVPAYRNMTEPNDFRLKLSVHVTPIRILFCTTSPFIYTALNCLSSAVFHFCIFHPFLFHFSIFIFFRIFLFSFLCCFLSPVLIFLFLYCFLAVSFPYIFPP